MSSRAGCWTLSVIGVLVMIGILSLPAVQSAREAAPRTQCRNNLKQIGLALYAYHDEYGTFPPAAIYDDGGNPMHSWRVLILPYIGQAALYEQYRFDEAWDGPHNRAFEEQMPSTYQCPTDKKRHRSRSRARTPYLAMTGPGTAFDGTEETSASDIRDGTSNTLLIAEVPGEYVHWMEPRDTRPESFIQSLRNKDSVDARHSGGSHALLADGAVRFISSGIEPEIIRATTTIAGGEKLEEF